MAIYAEVPIVRLVQVVRDLAVVSWCALWIWVATEVHGLVAKLGGVGRSLQETSDSLSNGVSDLPSITRSLAAPLNGLGDDLRNVGDAQVSVADDLALLAAVLTVAITVLPVVIPYVVKRIIWSRRVDAVVALRHLPHFDKLIAQRALLNQPLHRLAKVSRDPIQDFADGDHDALVELELRGLGVRLRR